MSTFAALGGKIDQEGGLKFLSHLYRSGYSLGMNVTQRGAGANMSVDINIDSTTSMAGGLFLTSANVPYYGWMDATVNQAISTADPTNPRIDVIAAYIDLSAISSAVTNNNGALKFKDVTGTPAGSPSAPNAAAIQSSVGAGNPYIILGNVTVAAAASSIVTTNISDQRSPMAFKGGYLWGGASNTKGHLVPNQADGTLVTTTDTNSISAQMLATSAITLGYSSITSAFTTTSISYVQVTGLTTSVTIPAGGRKIKVTAFAKDIGINAAGHVVAASIWDGTVGTGTQIAEVVLNNQNGTTLTSSPITMMAVVTPSAGAKTYNVAIKSDNASQTATYDAATTSPGFILVEAI